MNELDVFTAALELADSAARDAFLDQACGGRSELRSRIEALLRNAGQASRYLESPPAALVATISDLHITEAPGSTIGPYKLLEQIGEGGMGTVFMAEQQKPVRRLVALKIVKPGMDSQQVIARFEAERQALAMMNHPNIARVFDAGTTAAGRPYFVMELVRGIPITDYCDQARLPVPARLELFVQVCRAVQHAHTNGIIHRDLKPSNVLVTLNDDVAVPKIIDFGIAKAMHDRLTERTLFTQFAQIVGTPLYMSPEQAQMSNLGVDTRSDVYSLGVLLYELLTGTTPFDKETLASAGYDEMRRIIREDEPASVSARIGTLPGEQQTTISARRGVDTRALVRQTRGELDWIVMKALEKDRTRRYESASAFAADVQRHLADEPVEACPPSTLYRLRKFARRRRGLLTTAVLAGLAICIGTSISVWQAIEATQAKRLADNRLKNETWAREEADKQRGEAITQRQVASANFQKALDAVDQMLLRVADEELAGIAAVKPVREQLLRDALGFYERFLQERGDDPALRFSAAQAWQRVGEIRRRIGSPATAEDAFRKAAAVLDPLVRDFPDDPRYLHLLTVNCTYLGDEAHLNRALPVCQQLLQSNPDEPKYRLALSRILSGLSGVRQQRKEWPQAVELSREAIRIQKKFIEDYPEDVECRREFIRNFRVLGLDTANIDFDAADRLMAEGQELLETMIRLPNPNPSKDVEQAGGMPEALLVSLLVDRATIWRNANKNVDGQERMFRRAIEVAEGLFTAYPELDLLGTRSWWVRAHTRIATPLLKVGRRDEAEAFMRRALRWVSTQGRLPAVLGIDEVQLGFHNWAHTLHTLGRDDDEEFTATCEQLVRRLENELQKPELSQVPAKAVLAWIWLGRLYGLLNNRTRADEAFEKAAAIGEINIGSLSAELLIDHLVKSGRQSQTLPYLDRAIRSAVFATSAASYQRQRAQIHFGLGHYSDALADIAACVERKPDDPSNLQCIPPHQVTACPDENFRTGILALADKTVELTNGSADAYIARAALQMALGNLTAARTDLDSAVVVPKVAYYPRYLRAMLCLALHDESAYRVDCASMLRQFRDSRDLRELHFAAWTCALRPDGVSDWQPVLDLTVRAVEIASGSGYALQVHGAVLFRAGRYDEALQALEQSDAAPGDPLTSPVYGWYFLAMTQIQLRHSAEAQRYLDKALAETSRILDKTKPGDPDAPSWNRRLTLELLRGQATEMLSVPALGDKPNDPAASPADNVEGM